MAMYSRLLFVCIEINLYSAVYIKLTYLPHLQNPK